ncbi:MULTISPECIES: competence protein CoiA family protein [Calothrix]|uniref:GIY-YIG nuclease family protein n=2 Tax=Calothrix TaxID=1186 RepID=A0ABR8A3G3_9CYAN|nr:MULTISPECIES: competence protein CoiA family protein [Calothrix]MBD2194507.1 GIY-YIG nuclease family protein [Calothrix parietina FACHB-288]MBD2223387.1 GIY-YIG nuclease family protein [Calothrix anomala FACHB-343]
MWLKYGVDIEEKLICIEDIPRGKTSLKCPYCQGSLIAKKGKVKEHHFAHEQETCRPVANRQFPTLPLYDDFNIQLSGKDLAQLKLLWQEYGAKNYPISSYLVTPGLLKAGMLRKNVYLIPPEYELSDLGKIPVGALELTQFNELQEPLLLKKLLKLELDFEHAKHKKAADLAYRLTDLRLYRAQLKRVLACKLYFLEIETNRGILSKIGVTTRHIQERVAEIKLDLVKHYPEILNIKVLGTWEHRGNAEKYFKHRYQKFNYPIGSLTEYYKFNIQEANNVLSELKKMQPLILTQIFIEVLEDNSSLVKVAA